MYKIAADVVYVLDRVYKHPKSVERLERMLASIAPKKLIKISDAELDKLVVQMQWVDRGNIRTGGYHDNSTPTLIFNEFRFDAAEIRRLEKMYPSLKAGLFLGQNPTTTRAAINRHGPDWCVCQQAIELHSIFGCLHACDYYHIGKFVNIMLNLEDLLEHLQAVMEQNPGQQLWKYDNYTDQITFEPEYGASELLVPFFAKQESKYLLLYTKSDNIDHLLELEHGGKTIVNWSISTKSQSKYVEKKTPPLYRRLEAMKKCSDAGYIVRARLSPLIPLKNWKEEIVEMIPQLLACKPDVITMDVIGFMSPSVMRDALNFDLFDEEAQAIINKLAEDTQRSWGKLVFPHDFRAKMYRFVRNEVRKIDQDVPLSICNESFEMWEELPDVIGDDVTPEDFYCCCGPNSVPN